MGNPTLQAAVMQQMNQGGMPQYNGRMGGGMPQQPGNLMGQRGGQYPMWTPNVNPGGQMPGYNPQSQGIYQAQYQHQPGTYSQYNLGLNGVPSYSNHQMQVPTPFQGNNNWTPPAPPAASPKPVSPTFDPQAPWWDDEQGNSA